jgi:hypothetical protein
MILGLFCLFYLRFDGFRCFRGSCVQAPPWRILSLFEDLDTPALDVVRPWTLVKSSRIGCIAVLHAVKDQGGNHGKIIPRWQPRGMHRVQEAA